MLPVAEITMDKYEKKIRSLASGEGSIFNDWSNGVAPFGFVRPNDDWSDDNCGCLVHIRIGMGVALNSRSKLDEKLTEIIKGDDCIPDSAIGVKSDSLWVFAWWWRRLDRYYAGEMTVGEIENELGRRKEMDI